MTCQKFEEALDVWMSLPQAEQESQHGLSPELRRHVAGCPRCQQLRRDWLWLHRQIQAAPAPAPSEGFSDHVVAAYLASTSPVRNNSEKPESHFARRSSSRSDAIAWVGGLAAAAASFVIGLTLITGDPDATSIHNQEVASTSSPAAPLELSAGPAVGSLVDNVSQALAFGARNSTEPVVNHTEDFPDWGIRRAFKNSTDDILATSRELSSSIQPIAESAADAVGAFGFLWKDLAPTEKPRT